VKKFKIKKTIRSELHWYLLGLIVLLVFFYTFLLQEYFVRGIEISTKIEFVITGREYNQEKNKNPDIPLPQHPYLESYLDWSTASIKYQTLFPRSEHQNNKLTTIELYENNYEEVTQYIFMRYLLDNREYLYMVAKYPPNMLNQQQVDEFDNTVLITFPLALLFIVAAVLLIYHLGRRIGRSSDALNTWAEKLTLESLNQKRPDFHYAELNGVAERLQNAFQRIGSLLEKEHLFLQFTSHELRTPLAITQANVAILEKQGIEAQYKNSVARIKRANINMQNITDALLWLSRDSELPPNPDRIIIYEVLLDIINDHRYLLKEKTISIEIKKSTIELNAPFVLFKIIMSNLIRNAFQYTINGSVIIDIKENKIILRNQDLKNAVKQEKNLGFGLGLVLVEQLTSKLDWKLNCNIITGGREVIVSFIKNNK
jgi:signal transduction histidine kinase